MLRFLRDQGREKARARLHFLKLNISKNGGKSTGMNTFDLGASNRSEGKKIGNPVVF